MRLQAAIEYLVTYGWTLLIVAVVLAAFFALGITNPPAQQCMLPAGIFVHGLLPGEQRPAFSNAPADDADADQRHGHRLQLKQHGQQHERILHQHADRGDRVLHGAVLYRLVPILRKPGYVLHRILDSELHRRIYRLSPHGLRKAACASRLSQAHFV